MLLAVLLLWCHDYETTEVRARGPSGTASESNWSHGIDVLPFRRLRQRPGPIRPLLLRRPRLREGRCAHHRLRIRAIDGPARCGRDLTVHPQRHDEHRAPGVHRALTLRQYEIGRAH